MVRFTFMQSEVSNGSQVKVKVFVKVFADIGKK
jgi:hypothetical protein